jgi:hypothetical protein
MQGEGGQLWLGTPMGFPSQQLWLLRQWVSEHW